MIKFKGFGFSYDALSPSINIAGEESPSSLNEPQNNPLGKRVVIVDDDPVFSTATAMKLRSAGFHVRTVKEPAQAIAALSELRADAVLMDIELPPDVCNGGMGSWDGFQLMNWLRGLPTAKGVRFIMVSSSGSPANRQRAQQLGAVAYFQKPLDHDRLFALLNADN